MKNVHHNFPKLNHTSPYSLIYLPNGPKPTDNQSKRWLIYLSLRSIFCWITSQQQSFSSITMLLFLLCFFLSVLYPQVKKKWCAGTKDTGGVFHPEAFMLSALNSVNVSLYLRVWSRVDWRKWERGDVGLKESWGERGATYTPSQGQGGATHPSTQGERGAADAPAQCERVLETGVDT